MADLTDDIINIVISLFLVAFVGKPALDVFTGVDTSSWSDNLVTIWDNIPLIALVGILIGMLYRFIQE